MNLEDLVEELMSREPSPEASMRAARAAQPVHVVYGGADLFSEETPSKLGRLAISTLKKYAPDPVSFANAMWLKGADSLPDHKDALPDVLRLIEEDPERAEATYPGALFAKEVFDRTVEKLSVSAIEDLRIDFEDGYGFRTDQEEDSHCISASEALGKITASATPETPAPMFGFRIKSLAPETRRRAVRTLELFVTNLTTVSGGALPNGFVVTLPKVTGPGEVKALSELLSRLEAGLGLAEGSIACEVMIETPDAIRKLSEIRKAGGFRLRGAHFGAYDYTSLLGIASDRQHLHHDACIHARNDMLKEFAGSGIWLSDSVTTTMPVPLHRGEELRDWQLRENIRAVHSAWRLHVSNITKSMNSGFYQSWDLHPAQLAARYAAVYSFYLESAESQIARLRAFIDKASKATLTGNEFDDAASAEGILNFVRRGTACGALEIERTAAAVGLSPDELKGSTFGEIVNSR